MRIAHRIARRVGITLAVHSGWARRRFFAHRGELRILTYHGIAPDSLRDRPWLPSHYVTLSQFEQQMADLATVGPCPPLRDSLRHLYTDRAAAPVVCLTFDDGTADSVSLALPILRRYGHHATFFLATGGIGRDQPLPNDMVRLLRPAFQQGLIGDELGGMCKRILGEPGFAKRLSIRTLERLLTDAWAYYGHLADPDGVCALRMMDWRGVDQLLKEGMDIAAHTVHHAILGREDRLTRNREIVESIKSIQARTGQREVLFSYPNGEDGDYDEGDLAVLKCLDVPFAFTQQHGWNKANTPPLELRRHSIGLHGSHTSFLWEVLGADGADAVVRPAASEPVCRPVKRALGGSVCA